MSKPHAPGGGKKSPRPATAAVAAGPPHYGFWAHLKSATPVVLIVSVLTSIATYLGWFGPLETAALDFRLRLVQPVEPKFVWLIAITDEDYAELFHKTSPLDPQVLAAIVAATASGQPRVIGVDVDTTDSKLALAAPASEKAGWPPIIWAQNADQDGTRLRPLPVLGGAEPQPFTALGFFPPPDADKLVRRYRRTFPTAAGPVPSLPWALVEMFWAHDPHAAEHVAGKTAHAAEHEEPALLTFSETRHRHTRLIRAADVLRMAGGEGWKGRAPIRDQVALIGGTFGYTPDQYDTPFGRLAGVELIAQAVEAELQKKRIELPEELRMTAVELIIGFLMVIWSYFSRAWGGFALRLLALPVVALGASWLAVASLAYWASFVPILAGTLLHEGYEHWQEYRHLQRRMAGVNHPSP